MDTPPNPKTQAASEKGVYCSACGQYNPSWRSQCEACKTPLVAPGQIAALKTRDRPGCVLIFAVLLALYMILLGGLNRLSKTERC